MADKKISQLTSLAQGDIATTTDVLAIVDTSATETKKATPAAIVGAAAAAGLTNVDINSGAIDGTTIGANSAAAGTFTTLTGSTKTVSPFFDAVGSAGGQLRNASGTSQLAWGAGGGSNLSLEVATNINPANANVSLAPTGTGTVTINPATAGTMNNVAIGGTTAAAGSFTTLTTSSTVTLNGGTANGVLYLNGSKVATSGSALTFSGANLGVGIASASQRLHIFESTAATGAFLQTQEVGGQNAYFGVNTSGGSIQVAGANPLQFAINGTERMRLTSSVLYTDSSINVGIGTASPGAKLAIAQSSNAITQGLLLINAAGTQNGGWYHGGSALIGREGGFDTIALAAGNVGIGTASPGQKLEVAGNILVNTSGNPYAEIKTSGSGNNPYLKLTADTNSWTFQGTFSNANDDLLVLYNATTLLDLDKNGNLGLGVTPSAWGSGSTAFQIGNGAIWKSGSRSVDWITNGYYNGTNYIYNASAAATYYRQFDGVHSWYTSTDPTPTAGNTISFTQAMTLDASGNLGVGGTAASGVRLHIESGDTQVTIKDNNTNKNASPSTYINFEAANGRSGYIGYPGANDLYINNESSGNIFFSTNATERGRFTAGGYFKASNSGTYVSSTDPYHELRKDQDNSNPVVRIQAQQTTATNQNAIDIHLNGDPNNSTNYFIYGYGGGGPTQRFTMRSNGGLANYQTNDANLSDERTKKDIAPLGSMWAKFKALEIVTFKYKDQTHDDDNIGLIAQQVESVAPEFVDVDGWGETPEDGVPLKSIYTADMYHAAIKALQEAMARIEQLEADMAALKASA